MKTLRQDLNDEDYGRFYFLLSLCQIDAYDSNDYDRREILKGIIASLKERDYEKIIDGLDELESVV